MQAAQEETIKLRPSWHSMILAYLHLARTIWKKITLILLTLHSMYGLFLAVVFLFQKYPQLEEELAAHIIDRATVENVVIEAVILLFATVLEITMAVRLAQKKGLLEETIDTTIASALLLFSPQIKAYVATLEIVSHIMK
ncbi:MAG: hypothetical protein COU68_00290 [Candidatus Pacebacteria bacterium CG10_big_fil_rev_8_21_14_0_10_45_6]|nr:MAG: hypothetical protein COU68_00290 [Candidatus Pacebacteria bacterium CG10_big_fil_rev_8_21_14_0_10_45_6]